MTAIAAAEVAAAEAVGVAVKAVVGEVGHSRSSGVSSSSSSSSGGR